MLSRHIDVREIDHTRRPTVDHFQTACELAPEDIFRRMQGCCEIAFGKVLQQSLIGVASLEKSLPDVMVGVDEARRDDFVSLRWIALVLLDVGCWTLNV